MKKLFIFAIAAMFSTGLFAQEVISLPLSMGPSEKEIKKAEKHDEKVMKQLFKDNADVNARIDGNYGPTPLEFAISKGSLELVTSLVKRGADVNPKRSDHECTPLTYAIDCKQTKIAKYLIDSGADINAENPHWFGFANPLSVAISDHDEEIAVYMIEKGVNANSSAGKTGYSGGSVLMFAAQEGLLKVVKSLVEHGADVNDKGGLWDAKVLVYAKNGGTEVYDYLVSVGAEY